MYCNELIRQSNLNTGFLVQRLIHKKRLNVNLFSMEVAELLLRI